jgi:hypothetical protein
MPFVFLVLRIAIFTALIYGSIKIVDAYNTKNNWVTALVISVVFSLFANWVGGLLIVFPLFIYLLILTKYYDLGLIQSIISVVVLFLGDFLLSLVINALFLSSSNA